MVYLVRESLKDLFIVTIKFFIFFNTMSSSQKMLRKNKIEKKNERKEKDMEEYKIFILFIYP